MAINRLPTLRLQPLLLGVGFAILVAISAGTVWLVNQAATDAQVLAQRLTIQSKFSNVLLAIRRAESGQRGYLFTNNPAYLDDFNESGPEARRLIDELRGLVSAAPERHESLRRIAELTDAKFAEMNRIIALTQAGQTEAARTEVQRGEGRALMNKVRVLLEEAIAGEARIAAARTQQSQRNSNLLLYLSLIGAAVIVLIGTLSIALVQRNARQREIAQQELAGTNANLERIVEHRTADLTEANEEIQRFAYIVSHDLRSPLVNVMGFTSELEALRKEIFEQVEKLRGELAALNAETAGADAEKVGQLGEDFDEAIRFIKSSIGNMDRLINAVLKLSREGRRQFHPEQLDIGALIESILQNVAHRASEQGATLRAGTLPPVDSDRLALEQVFTNLIDNALKYGRPDEPLQIEIEGRIEGNRVIYDFRDNGRGIDARDHQRIFELFRRSGQQDRPGEGIGLAHVRALVRRLGGTMGLKSELGRGSTFTVILPRRWSAENRSAA